MPGPEDDPADEITEGEYYRGMDEAREPKSVFTNCNVCGIKLRTPEEDQVGMCERCAAE